MAENNMNINMSADLNEEILIGNPKKKNGGKIAQQIFSIGGIIFLTLPFVIMFIYALALGGKAAKLMPYYSFWPFLGALFLIIPAIPYAIAVPLIFRKKSKSSQIVKSIKVSVAYFGIILCLILAFDYILPNLISKATQNTLYMEDVYYNTDKQIEDLGKLDRKFFMATLTSGAYDAELGYQALAEPEVGYQNHKVGTAVNGYKNEFIDSKWREYEGNPEAIETTLKSFDDRQKEFYDYLYKNHVLRDLNYSLIGGTEKGLNTRRALALAVFEKEYPVFKNLCKIGFNKRKKEGKRLLELRQKNFDALDKDGYQTFVDPGINFAQRPGRQTVPVLLRLIANPRYEATKPKYDEDGKLVGYDDFLFETSDIKALREYEAAGGEFDEKGKSTNLELSKGKIIYRNGKVEIPMKWTVLDMDGKAQTILSKKLSTMQVGGLPLGNVLETLLASGTVSETINQVLNGVADGNGVDKLVKTLSGGGKLSINPLIDDNGNFQLELCPQSAEVGQLGYQDASWLNSTAQLLGVVNLTGVRMNLYILGAVGLFLIIAACIMLEEKNKMKKMILK